MSDNSPDEIPAASFLDRAHRLHENLTHQTPALKALFAFLRDDQAAQKPTRARRSRRTVVAVKSGMESCAHDNFVLRVVVAYCNGSTQQQIASSLGIHVQTVRATLRDAGVKLSEHNAAFSVDELQIIRRLHAEGISARELGRRYGVAHTTILRRLR